jgi:hypothetical protein
MADPDAIWEALTPEQKETLILAAAVFLADPVLPGDSSSARKSPKKEKDDTKNRGGAADASGTSSATKTIKSEYAGGGTISPTKGSPSGSEV